MGGKGFGTEEEKGQRERTTLGEGWGGGLFSFFNAFECLWMIVIVIYVFMCLDGG